MGLEQFNVGPEFVARLWNLSLLALKVWKYSMLALETSMVAMNVWYVESFILWYFE